MLRDCDQNAWLFYNVRRKSYFNDMLLRLRMQTSGNPQFTQKFDPMRVVQKNGLTYGYKTPRQLFFKNTKKHLDVCIYAVFSKHATRN